MDSCKEALYCIRVIVQPNLHMYHTMYNVVKFNINNLIFNTLLLAYEIAIQNIQQLNEIFLRAHERSVQFFYL